MIHIKQNEIIEALGISKNFDEHTEMRKRIDFLKNYLVSNGKKSLVLGISGGIDSTTAGALAQCAIDDLNIAHDDPHARGYKFIAVRLPYHTQKDGEEAQKALDFIGPNEIIDLNIGGATDEVMLSFDDSYGTSDYDFNKGNVKARMRMIMQYAVAGFNNGLVIGTDHAAEAVMGFFTKFGDGAADILPLAGLNKRRVRAIATWLGAPRELVYKTPTADLEDDKPQLPDEVAFGVTYDQIDDFLEGKEIDIQAAKKIISAYTKTQHKRNLPVAYS